MKYDSPFLVIEDSRTIWENFEGKPGTYHKEGDRFFGVLVTEEIADALKEDGWKVLRFEGREPVVKINIEPGTFERQLSVYELDIVVSGEPWIRETTGQSGRRGILQSVDNSKKE